MAIIYDEPSRTFNEYLLVPGYTGPDCVPSAVTLETPLVKFKKGEKSEITLKIPLVSAIMQSVSNDKMAVALAQEGGISFIYCSQSIEDEAKMVAKVKKYKAGFVVSDSTITPKTTLKEVMTIKNNTGHNTMPVTEDGSPNGKLVGILTSRDYRPGKVDLADTVEKYMTPLSRLVTAQEGTTLSECNDIIWDHKINALPIVDKNGNLCYLVFRKDYDSHKTHPLEVLDSEKRFIVGAGINTRDYEKRVPALVEAGADVLCIDSSEGFSAWQQQTIDFIKKKYNGKVRVGAGNVVDADGFNFLAEAGADFIKVGIGGGSICITREQKGIGRGQATALIEVVKARDEYYKKTGVYVPVCSDGGIVYDYHMTLALAMGADFLMLGRYFARFDESPTDKLFINGAYVKEYWGEGSNRARNWQRYDLGEEKKGMVFEEGVDSYVPYAGSLHDNVERTLNKIKSTMCNCGATDIATFHKSAKLTLVSATSIVEGGAHDVIPKERTPRS